MSAMPKISRSPASSSSTCFALRQAGVPSLLAHSRVGVLSGAAGFANGKCMEQPPKRPLQLAATSKPLRKRVVKNEVGQPGDGAGGKFSGAYSKACTSLAICG